MAKKRDDDRKWNTDPDRLPRLTPEQFQALSASARSHMPQMVIKVSALQPGSVFTTVGDVLACDSVRSCSGCEWSDRPHWHRVPASS